MKCCKNCYYCRINHANIGKKYECTNLKTAYRKGPFTFHSSILNGIKCKHFRSKGKLDQDTEQIIHTLLMFEKRPGLFFPEKNKFISLHYFLLGISYSPAKFPKWEQIYEKVQKLFYEHGTEKLDDRTQRTYFEWDMSEEEQFKLWFRCLHEVIDAYI